MHPAAQKTARTLISHSPFHWCARKISRFARNDDAGKALLSFSAYLKRFSISLSYRQCPIRPFGAPSPRGEGFGCGAAVSSFRRLLHGGKDLGLLPPSSGRREKGADVGSRSGMRRKVRQPILPFRHPECSRGIFLAGGKTVPMRKSVIPSRMKSGVSRSSHIFCLTGVQGRFLDFARNDDTGKAIHDKRRSRPLHFSFERASTGNHGL